MYEVSEALFGVPCRTRVWASRPLAKELAKFRKRDRLSYLRFMERLQYCAAYGFDEFEGEDASVRPEGQGVYRIGTRGSLFRILGFYNQDSRAEFIAIDGFLKKGQRLGPGEREKMKHVARVKRDGLWRKVDGDGPFVPRLVP